MAQRDGDVRFVQLPHPGPEHKVDESGVRPWRTSKDAHGRTFLASKAHYRMNLNEENQVGDVAFWGEWEGEAKLDLRMRPTSEGPLWLCRPNPYGKPPSQERGGPQNTDPFVWGDCFVYSICRQPGNQKLRSLGRGSVILFGSSVAKKFVIDTVLVVADWIEYDRTTSRERLGWVTSAEHMRAATEPLCESAGNEAFRCYFGATPTDPVSGMYSFVPCKPYAGAGSGFARPAVDLPELIKPRLTQQAGSSEPKPIVELFALWQKVVDQVLQQGLALGTRFELPTA